MAGWQLLWFELSRYWETRAEWVATPADVVARLGELERRFWDGEQLCVAPQLRAANGEELYVGLAGDHWLLMHVGTGDGEYTWAVGDLDAPGTLRLHFPSATEVSRKTRVR
jgi:hypothetical protein